MLVDHHTVVETPMTTTLPDPRPGCPASVYLRKVEIQPDGMRDSDKCRFCGAHYEKAGPWLCPDCKRKIDAYNAAQTAAPSAELQEVTREYLEMTKDEYAMCDERHECSQCDCRRRLIAAVEKAEKEGK